MVYDTAAKLCGTGRLENGKKSGSKRTNSKQEVYRYLTVSTVYLNSTEGGLTENAKYLHTIYIVLLATRMINTHQPLMNMTSKK